MVLATGVGDGFRRAMAAKKTTEKGKRYSEEEKAAILKFVDDHGRGGASAAAKK